MSRKVSRTISSLKTVVDEVFLDQGFFIDVDAKTKGNSINWPSQPEEIGEFVVLPPFLLTVLLFLLDASSIRESIYIFHPSSWYGTRFHGSF